MLDERPPERAASSRLILAMAARARLRAAKLVHVLGEIAEKNAAAEIAKRPSPAPLPPPITAACASCAALASSAALVEELKKLPSPAAAKSPRPTSPTKGSTNNFAAAGGEKKLTRAASGGGSSNPLGGLAVVPLLAAPSQAPAPSSSGAITSRPASSGSCLTSRGSSSGSITSRGPSSSGSLTSRQASGSLTSRQASGSITSRGKKASTDPLADFGYITLSPIAQGSFSRVVRAKHVHSNREVAIKTFATRQRGGRMPADLDCVRQEIDALSLLQPSCHENIANIIETMENDYELHVVLEYCSGMTLLKHLNSKGAGVGLDEREAARIAAQVGTALAHMHEVGVTHRDVKPGNVVFSGVKRETCKLVDFGFAKVHNETNGRLRTVLGSPAYMAPELNGKPYLGPPVDVWALGCMLYELLHSKAAFRAESLTQLNSKIRKAMHAQFDSEVSKPMRAIIKRSLTVTVAQRPDAAAVAASLAEMRFDAF